MSATVADEHIAKADQFLAAGELAFGEKLWDAAASCAVSAGIHANDAICLARLGRFSTAKSHGEAVSLARTAGPDGRAAATQLTRLLAVKNKAQYDSTPIGASSARMAVDTAKRLVELAHRVRAG